MVSRKRFTRPHTQHSPLTIPTTHYTNYTNYTHPLTTLTTHSHLLCSFFKVQEVDRVFCDVCSEKLGSQGLPQPQPWHHTAVPQWDLTLQEREGQEKGSERKGQGKYGRLILELACVNVINSQSIPYSLPSWWLTHDDRLCYVLSSTTIAIKSDEWIIVPLKWSRLRITRRNSCIEEWWWQQANMNASAGARNRFQPAGVRILNLNTVFWREVEMAHSLHVSSAWDLNVLQPDTCNR